MHEYFGPFVVAGAYCDEKLEVGLRQIGVSLDKKITDEIVEDKAAQIKKLLGPDRYEISVLQPLDINRFFENKGFVSKILVSRYVDVIEKLLKKFECGLVFVDTSYSEKLVKSVLDDPDCKVKFHQAVKAESDSAVTAASILARAAFIDEIGAACRMLGEDIPKGVGELVSEFAKRVFEKFGPDKLRELVKLYYKNTAKLGFDYKNYKFKIGNL